MKTEISKLSNLICMIRSVVQLFVSHVIVDIIVEETNRYTLQNTQKGENASVGIIFWMGLKKGPKLSDYWSKCQPYDSQIKCDKIRLQKLAQFITNIVFNFQKVMDRREICIDEILVPFRGRLSVRQDTKNKKHKFGVRVYKNCLEGGYFYDLMFLKR